MRLPLFLCAALTAVLVQGLSAGAGEPSGPSNGWLVLDGGGELSAATARRFVNLAGGPGAELVIIPTAQSDENIDTADFKAMMGEMFGSVRLTVLHTRDRDEANSEAFVAPIRAATGLWFGGGRTWRLADAYLGTAVERELRALLARGGVVGGTSAGATIQGSLLIRGQPGPPFNTDGDNTVLLAPGHETGFGLLRDTAVDQHVNVRHREGDLEPLVASHAGLLGIGLDEGAAIVVHADAFEVMGGRVTIYDGVEHSGTRHYFLTPGQVYSLKSRKVDPTRNIN